MTEPPETDRLAEGYEPRFDIDYSEVGRPGELFVMGIIEGLKSDRVEVKTDQVSQTTGNIYVEYACKKQGQYKPSGLAVTEASLWVFVLEPAEAKGLGEFQGLFPCLLAGDSAELQSQDRVV